MTQQSIPAPIEHSNPWPRVFVELRFGMARSAIQGALVLNGGAAAALMALVSNLAAAGPNSRITADFVFVRLALQMFGIGVFLAASTFVVAYMATFHFFESPVNRTGHRYRRAAISMVIASLVHFLLGMAFAALAISTK